MIISKLTAGETPLQIVVGDLFFELCDHAVRNIGGKNRVSPFRKIQGVDSCSRVEFEDSAAGIHERGNMIIYLFPQIREDGIGIVCRVVLRRLIAEGPVNRYSVIRNRSVVHFLVSNACAFYVFDIFNEVVTLITLLLLTDITGQY